jgi:hypothetical protein
VQRPQRPQGLERQVLALALALKRLMVLRALVQLPAARALAQAKQKLLAVVFDLDLVWALVWA